METLDAAVMLDVRRLTKQFTLHESNRTLEAVHDVSFRLRAGHLAALVGASGCGKSSILKCIYRTYRATSGEVHYQRPDGTWVDLIRLNEPDVLDLRRREIRFVSQFFQALPRQVTLDVVAWPLLELHRPLKSAREAAADMLRRIGVPETLWDIPPHTFSGGERQLVNLARALVVKPRLLLLDEPTASLDPASADRVIEVIEQLKSPEIAVLTIFHNRSIVARVADVEISMEGGLRLDPSRVLDATS